jgi:chromosome segregation ATPase
MDEQKNLFGEIDAVYNTLETELKFVGDEISKNQKSIDRAKDKIMSLEERRVELRKSIEIVRAQRDQIEDDEDTKPIEPTVEEDAPEVEGKETQIDVELTDLLVTRMLENNANSKTVKNLTLKRRADWINSCRLMREKDERDPEQIRAMIEFSQKDTFWRSNILSMPKLREKFDQLWLKAEQNNYSGIQRWLNEKTREDTQDPF